MSTTSGAAPDGCVFEPDPVIELYKRDLDRSLLRENLRLTPEERVRKLAAFMRLVDELKRAGRQLA